MHPVHRFIPVLLPPILAALLCATAAATDTGSAEIVKPSESSAYGETPAPGDDALVGWLTAARTLKQDQPELFRDAEGVMVTEESPEGQGAAAGLLPGDVIIAYGDTPVDSADQLVALVGETHRDQPIDYQEALKRYKQALAIDRELDDKRGQAAHFTNIGNVYADLGRYQEALSRLRQALSIRREIPDRRGEGGDLSNIGLVYSSLGRYQEALDYHRQALTIHRELGDRSGEWRTLGAIGMVLRSLGRYQDALEHYEQELAIAREIRARHGEASAIRGIGSVYQDLDRDQDALGRYKESLAIAREIGDRRGEARALLNLGWLHDKQGQTNDALSHFQKALALQVGLQEPETLWRLWMALGQLWYGQSQRDATILAGKRAVNSIQRMRAVSSGLQQTLQRSFLKDKDFIYRDLADLLIDAKRPAEAQQVLDMLKEREFCDYIQQDDTQDPRAARADYNELEAQWNRAFDETADQLAEPGRSLSELTRIHPDVRTEQEQADIERLSAQRDALSARIQRHLDDLVKNFDSLDPARQGALNAEMADRPGTKRALLAALSARSGSKTGLLQYILLGDKVRILLTTPRGWHTAVAEIASDDLNAETETLRQALTNPVRDATKPAQTLYQHLVAPVAEAIAAAGLQSLLVDLDGRLRYIPFAALYDGQHYLVERYPLVVYTAASERQAESSAAGTWRVAGLGTTRAHPGFSALPAIKAELEGIVRHGTDDPDGVLPGSVHLDAAFTEAALRRAAADRANRLLHIATHFDLKPGNDSQSSLLLGTGERLSLRALRTAEPALDLRHIDLVTLSACNTAIGGADAAGAEIEGMGTIMQRQGARGVLASLWSVADTSTGQLMQILYRLRREHPELTKAEALQRAQLALMGSDAAGGTGQRGPRGVDWDQASDDAPDSTSGANRRYAHPYYWAPFILMGNWL